MAKECICKKCKHCGFLTYNMGGEISIDCYANPKNEYDEVFGRKIRCEVQSCDDFELPDFDTDCWDVNGNFKPEFLPVLRSQITLGSSYLSDYKNSFGIDPDFLISFFDEYDDWLSRVEEEETEENLLYWYSDAYIGKLTQDCVIKSPL